MKVSVLRCVIVSGLWCFAACDDGTSTSDASTANDATAGEDAADDGSVNPQGDGGSGDGAVGAEAGANDSGSDAGSRDATTADAGGDAASDASADATSDAQTEEDAGVTQVPPIGTLTELEAWIATGEYERWHCEDAVHANRAPSPHGFNRICVNDAVSAVATGTGPWPVGAAAVKELYVSAGDAEPSGYAVSVKTSSAGGEGDGQDWYWFERWTNGTVFADGMGVAGCAGCHEDAGAANATPSTGSRDNLFTPVP